MKALKKAREWLKQLKEDIKRESVSQMRAASPCCSKPIEAQGQGGKRQVRE